MFPSSKEETESKKEGANWRRKRKKKREGRGEPDREMASARK